MPYNECRTDQVLCTVFEGNGNIIYFHVIQMENDADHTCHNSHDEELGCDFGHVIAFCHNAPDDPDNGNGQCYQN